MRLINRKVLKYPILFLLINMVICLTAFFRLRTAQNTISLAGVQSSFMGKHILILLLLLIAVSVEILLIAYLCAKQVVTDMKAAECQAEDLEKLKSDTAEELFSDFINGADHLTHTERLIFNQYLEEKPVSEILENLGITMNTLKVHNNHIYKKLNVSSKEELTLYINLIRKSGMLSELERG